jgi:DNA-binding MarR family transcriptional regulator
MSTRDESKLPAAAAALSNEDAEALGEERAAQVRSFRLLIRIAQHLRYLTDQLYRVDGLTTQPATLLSLVRTRGKPSLSELAGAMFSTHQNVKQVVNALVAKGFLRLVYDANDARVRRVVTTPKNQRHWAKRNPQDFERVAEWLSALSVAEVKQLYRLLAKLQDGLMRVVEREADD